jgi:hypothetical protein
MTEAASSPGLLALLFGSEVPVDRKRYLLAGAALMLVKYGLDAGLIYATTGHLWQPLEYLSPTLSTRTAILGGGNEWALALMIAWALPFMWIGLSMSLRRTVDAGLSPGLALLFLVPGANYLLMLLLVALPSTPARVPVPQAMKSASRVVVAMYGIATGVGLAVGLTLFSTLVLGEYGQMLVLVAPALIGASTSWFFNRDHDQGVTASLMVALLATVIAGAAILLFALEGMICLIMALPIAGVMAMVGALIGRQMARAARPSGAHVIVLFLATPLLTAFESALPAPLIEREVSTSVIIDAPPDRVWPNVIGFTDLGAPPGLIYAAGVAYPLRARIFGEGVGAVRHCEFTTGPFVEPITVWDPPTRLGFDVTSQPPPMHEWSPYTHVHPPHLDGYLKSRRGEFRLIDLGDGRTRLEGSTWYTIDLAPSPYWALWSDQLMHGIHDRVLTHIKRLSERN